MEFRLYFLFATNTFTLCNQFDTMQTSLPYSPPDLNRNITEIFGKLINIYRGEIKFISVFLVVFSFALLVI